MKKIVLLVFLLWGAAQVLAHGYVVTTDPIDGAELVESPQKIQVWFNEPLVVGSGEISAIRSSTGENIPLSETVHDENDTTLIYAGLSSKLEPGAYLVTAKAQVQSDGHEPSSSFIFWVGQKSQSAANTEETRPTYEVFAFYMGLLVAAGAIGAWLMRKNPLEIVRPAHDTSHISLP